MITLSHPFPYTFPFTFEEPLGAAQKAGGAAIWEIVLEKSGFTTYTYTYADNRILDIRHTEIDGWLRSAEVELDDSDGVIRPINLLGYQITIGYGYTTSYGDQYVGWIFNVISQTFQTRQGKMTCSLSCAGLGNQLEKDIASCDYFPADDATTTVKGYIDLIKGNSLACFSHTTAFTVDWDVEDWLIDDFAPADSFKIFTGQNKLDKIKELLSYTDCDGIVKSNNNVGIFMTGSPVWQATYSYVVNQIVKPTSPSDWAANTAYILNDRVKPTSTKLNGFWYVCTTAGTSHAATEPTWVTKDGLTITDGSVTWTCHDSNYIYTCTTAGVSGGTEPVWTYTADGTITDNSIVWTLKYAYQYAQTTTGHNFFAKETRNRLVIPNKMTVKSHPTNDVAPLTWAVATDYILTDIVKPTTPNGRYYVCTTAGTSHAATEPTWPTTYGGTVVDEGVTWTDKGTIIISGSATEPASYARLPKDDFMYLMLPYDNNVTATNIATAKIDRNSRDSETGSGYVMNNVGQECQDWVLITDAWMSDAVRGRVRSIIRHVSPGQFDMWISFSSRIAQFPLGMLPSLLVGRELAEPIPEWALQLQEYMYKNDNLMIDEINKLRLETERIIWEGGFNRPVCIKVIAEDTALTTGDGKAYFTVPPQLNGRNLVEAYAVVYTPSTSGTPTIQIHNATDAVDMLSTAVTIDINKYNSLTATTPAVINTSYDDVISGDRLRIDCDVAGTSVTGLDIFLVFALPRS